MTSKQSVKEMCDVMAGGLSWIDEWINSGVENELVTKLQAYRQALYDYAESYQEGDELDFPWDPRFPS